MQDHTALCDSTARLGELEKAFGVFNRLSNELQDAYRVLEQRVARLSSELEEARRAREAAASEALRTAERLRSLLATLPGGVVVVDDSGCIREMNRVAAELLGGERSGQAWQRVVRDVLKPPSSADGDWLTRDGRRIALAASTLAEESVKIILLTDVTETRALQELDAQRTRYRDLHVTRQARLDELGGKVRERQLQIFLDTFSIERADIDAIGPARVATLQSYGVETAADVNRATILAIPGFGPAYTERLLDWRRAVERASAWAPSS